MPLVGFAPHGQGGVRPGISPGDIEDVGAGNEVRRHFRTLARIGRLAAFAGDGKEDRPGHGLSVHHRLQNHRPRDGWRWIGGPRRGLRGSCGFRRPVFRGLRRLRRGQRLESLLETGGVACLDGLAAAFFGNAGKALHLAVGQSETHHVKDQVCVGLLQRFDYGAGIFMTGLQPVADQHHRAAVGRQKAGRVAERARERRLSPGPQDCEGFAHGRRIDRREGLQGLDIAAVALAAVSVGDKADSAIQGECGQRIEDDTAGGVQAGFSTERCRHAAGGIENENDRAGVDRRHGLLFGGNRAASTGQKERRDQHR